MKMCIIGAHYKEGEYKGKEYAYTYFTGFKLDSEGNIDNIVVCRIRGNHAIQPNVIYHVNVIAYDGGKYIVNHIERR